MGQQNRAADPAPATVPTDVVVETRPTTRRHPPGDPPGNPPGLLALTRTTGPRGESVVVARGEVDSSTGPDMLAALLDAMRVPACTGLVVDLSGVGFMGAQGITVLARIRAETDELGVPLAVVATQRAVLRPLHITAAVIGFALHPTTEAALGSWS